MAAPDPYRNELRSAQARIAMLEEKLAVLRARIAETAEAESRAEEDDADDARPERRRAR